MLVFIIVLSTYGDYELLLVVTCLVVLTGIFICNETLMIMNPACL